jgi:hypothetical protein
MYSPDDYEIISEVNSVTCITILSLIFGRKLASIDGSIHYVRGLLLLLYGLSWAFNLIACMLTSTNNGNFLSCVLTNFNCAVIYTSAKVVLYLYFIEKVIMITIIDNVALTRSIDSHHIRTKKLAFQITVVSHQFRPIVTQHCYHFSSNHL